MIASSFTWGDLAYLALAVFLVVVGVSLGYAFLRLGETFGRLSAFIRGTERELLPVITKVGGTVDRVNGQLDKVDQMTDSAVDAVESVDTAVRAVSMAGTTPGQKVAGFAAGRSPRAGGVKGGREWGPAAHGGRAVRGQQAGQRARSRTRGRPLARAGPRGGCRQGRARRRRRRHVGGADEGAGGGGWLRTTRPSCAGITSTGTSPPASS